MSILAALPIERLNVDGVPDFTPGNALFVLLTAVAVGLTLHVRSRR